jgi:hypothetical protein
VPRHGFGRPPAGATQLSTLSVSLQGEGYRTAAAAASSAAKRASVAAFTSCALASASAFAFTSATAASGVGASEYPYCIAFHTRAPAVRLTGRAVVRSPHTY